MLQVGAAVVSIESSWLFVFGESARGQLRERNEPRVHVRLERDGFRTELRRTGCHADVDGWAEPLLYIGVGIVDVSGV